MERGETESGAERFDHEKLDVYWAAREFLVLAAEWIGRGKLPRDFREQFDRASTSILFNIGEGAGKMARAEKQRFYEIARGSTLETATQLDLMQIRGILSAAEYEKGRKLLLRIAAMLSRLTRGPRLSG